MRAEALETNDELRSSAPEVQLILQCLRADHPPAAGHELVSGQIDWSVLCDLAAFHGVLPQVCRRLPALASCGVTIATLEGLKAAFVRTHARNLWMASALVRMMDALESNGIPAAAFKGPVLAMRAHGDLASRQFEDLDILVLKEDIPRVTDLMLSRGARPIYSFTTRQEKLHLRDDKELSFVCGSTGIEVDVHWRFASDSLGFGFASRDSLARRETLDLLGSRVSALALVDEMLCLCVQAAHDGWSRLAAVRDLSALLAKLNDLNNRDDPAWTGVLRAATENRMERAFLLGAALVKRILGVSLPPSIQEVANRDRRIDRLARRITSEMARERAPVRPREWAMVQVHLGLLDSVMDRIKYCARRGFIPTARDWHRSRIPDSLFPLFYCMRPVRLAGRFVRR